MAIAGPARYPLYDPRFEHDACGVGFVADAGGRSAASRPALALAGLASRATVAHSPPTVSRVTARAWRCPWSRHSATFSRLAGGAGPGVLCSSCRLTADARDVARVLVERSLAAERLSVAAWRDVPVDPGAIGGEARATHPGTSRRSCPRRPDRDWPSSARCCWLVVASRSVASAIGLLPALVGFVAQRRLQGSRRGRTAGGALPGSVRVAQACPVSHAVFHQRYATNTDRPGGWHSRSGSSRTTARSTRCAAIAKSCAGGPPTWAAHSERDWQSRADPHADGSDSFSLDEALDLLLAAGWRIDTALALALPDAPSMRERQLLEWTRSARRTRGSSRPGTVRRRSRSRTATASA